MYRPFLFFIISFIPGIILGNLISSQKIFLTIAVFCILIRSFCRNKRAKVAFLILSIMFSGAFYYNFRLDCIDKDLMRYALKHETLVGIIANSPVVKNNKVMYDVNIQYILNEGEYQKIGGKLRLSSNIDDGKQIYTYGDIIKFSGKIRIPQGRRNPGGIDYRAYLLQRGIATIMFSREIRCIALSP